MFKGLVVLELSQVFAGPLCSRLFAEQGATVIKVERPAGDVSRQLPFRVNGRSGYFVQQNRGKLGVSLNLKVAGGQTALWSLIRVADVLIDGFGPGVLERFGFTPEKMLAANERLIVCHMSALGRTGTLGSAKGYDQVGACYSGVAYTCGGSDASLPVMPSVALGDSMMGMCAYAGIVTALYERTLSGKGQCVDVSLVDGYIQSHSNNIEAYSLSGGRIEARPVDGQNATVCPSGVFKTPDGKHLYIVALSNEEWVRICACLGASELAGDPSLANNEGRVAARARIIGVIQDWLEACGDRDTALRRLLAADVVAAPVLDIGEVIANEHLRERGTVEIINDDVLGDFAVPGPPFRLSRSGRQSLAAAPKLGEHNEYALQHLGGLAPEAIEALRADGALVAE